MKQRKGDSIDRIIRAAFDEFAEKGFGAANLSRIASAAGVTKQLLNYYFSSKDELYRCAFEIATNALDKIYDEDNYLDLEPRDAVAVMINNIVQVHYHMPAIAQFTLDEGTSKAAHIDRQSAFVQKTRRFIRQIVTPVLARGAECGVFRSDVDPALFYVTACQVGAGCFLIGNSMKETVDLDFDSPDGVAKWEEHALSVILGWLRP